MALIHTNDSDIRPQDLTLDFYLEATPIGGGKPINMTGLDSYKIGPFESNLGFGITSIDIDVKPNLQPVVSITFKDLYGNLIFSDDQDGTELFNYKVLFQLPYPKFRLYVKGYLGKPVSFLLQVKSVKTTFVPTDGSYEIKAEFVPNVFGFFNDIPYQFLFAVKELKKFNGDTTNETDGSIIEIARVGSEISTKVQQATDKYGPLISQLQTISANYNAIGIAWRDQTLKIDPIPGDTDLIGKDFKPITFNINTKNAKGETINQIPDDQLEVFGKSIYLSINSPTPINLNDSFTKLSANTTTELAKKQELAVKKTLSNNLKIVQEVSEKQAYSTVEDKFINTQSIYNVMTRLAGDCAYILGYILEGGLAGYNSQSNIRQTNEEIFGNYYPLIENKERTAEGSAFGEQIPWNQAEIELAKVEEFVKALYTGNQEANKVIEEVQAQNEGTESGDASQGGNTVVSTNPFFCYQDITAFSDARVKDNVEVVDNAVEKIKAIRGVTFTRNDVEDKNKRHAGVIAQGILEVLPEVVSKDERGHYSVAYGNMSALLIEAIKEQQKQIEDLKQQINYLVDNK